MTAAYPSQQDLVWIATDTTGNVAAFITAGEGPIPKTILDYPDLVLEEWEDSVLELPVSSEATIFIAVSKPEAYRNFAERGLFVYDWLDFHRYSAQQVGHYELVAAPVKAIHQSQLPHTLQALSGLVSLPDSRFENGSGVNPARNVVCLQAATG